MTGIIIFFAFLLYGLVISRSIFADRSLIIRCWAGTVIGLVCFMWAVVPFAFMFGFTALSHGAAILFMGMMTWCIFQYTPSLNNQRQEDQYSRGLLLTILGMSLLIILLMNRHMIYPKDGNWLAGPGAYGDLPLHLAMITNLVEQGKFPPEYPIFAGARMGYPFLVNSLSASLHLFGVNLRWAILIPSIFLVFAVVAGFTFFAQKVLEDNRTAILATILFFFNGGLAFIYYIGDLPSYFRQYYTPNNDPAYNLDWWSIISHILIPQRASLAGWAVLFFILWLLYSAICERNQRYFFIAGIMTGFLPMIHSPSYFIMLIIALSWFVVYSFREKNKLEYVKKWAIFFSPAIILFIPQLLIWIIPQVFRNTGAVRFHFNWGNQEDAWIWYWIKNAGLIFLLMFPALLTAKRQRWLFICPALVLYLIAELFVFQRFESDNNKIFFIWYAFIVIIVAEYLLTIYRRFKVFKGRSILLGVIIFFSILSGLLTVTHDFVKTPVVFSAQQIMVSEFVRKKTLHDGLFITGDVNNNHIASLAGRRVLAGSRNHLYSHGLDFEPRYKDIKIMYTDPSRFSELRDKYDIDYVYLSNYERKHYGVTDIHFQGRYPVIFVKEDILIFAVSERAQQFHYSNE